MAKQAVNGRREFLKGVGLLGATGAVVGSSSAVTAAAGTSQQAKNLIFLVADGMGHGTLALAQHWSLRQRRHPLHWMQLYNRPGFHRSLQDTVSANSPVTDSAAAASAWGSGHRVNNRALNTDPAGKALTPLYARAKRAGKATGLVSTCRITHATPAGFAASVPHRNMEDAIAEQYYWLSVVLAGLRTSILRSKWSYWQRAPESARSPRLYRTKTCSVI